MTYVGLLDLPEQGADMPLPYTRVGLLFALHMFDTLKILLPVITTRISPCILWHSVQYILPPGPRPK